MAHEPLPIEGVASCVLAAWHHLPLTDRVRGVSTEDDAALVRYFMSPPPEETDERQPDLTLESLFGWLFATDIPHGGLTFLAEPQGATEKAAVWRALAKPLVRAVKAQDHARPKYGQFIRHPPPVASVQLMLQSSRPDIILVGLRVARLSGLSMIEQVLPQWEPLLRHTDDAIRRSATNTLSVHVCTSTPNAPNAAQVRLLQRLVSTLPDEKDPKVLAKRLEIMTCAKADGWFTPSELLSLSVHGVLHEDAQVAANAEQLLSRCCVFFDEDEMQHCLDLSAKASRLVGELIDNTELEWVRVESLVSLTLDHLATQPESQQLRDILPLEILEALRARRLVRIEGPPGKVWWSLAKDQKKNRWRLRTASFRCLQLLCDGAPVFSRIIADKLKPLLRQPGLSWPVRENMLLLTRLVMMQLGPMPAFSKLPFKYLNDAEWRVRTTAFHTVLCQEARQRTTNLLKTLSRSASVAEDAARLMGDSARFSSVHEGTMVSWNILSVLAILGEQGVPITAAITPRAIQEAVAMASAREEEAAKTGGAFLRMALSTRPRELTPELPAIVRRICYQRTMWKLHATFLCDLVRVLGSEMGPYAADLASGIEAAFITFPGLTVPKTHEVLPAIRALVLLSVHHAVAAPAALLGYVTRLKFHTGLLPTTTAAPGIPSTSHDNLPGEVEGLANLLIHTFVGSNNVDTAAATREQRAAEATGALLLMVRLVNEVMAPRFASGTGFEPSTVDGAASAETRAKVLEAVRVAVEWGAAGASEEEREGFVRRFAEGHFSNVVARQACADHLLSFVGAEAALARSASAPPTLPDVLLALAARDQ